MNAQRRKQITAAQEKIRAAIEALETLRDEEQDSFENLPESMQQGERGEKMQSAVDSIESAIGDLENAESSLEEATQ